MSYLPSPLQVAVALESSAVGYGLPASPADPGRPSQEWVASGQVEGQGRPTVQVAVAENDDTLIVTCDDGTAVLTGTWTAHAVAGLICAAAGHGIGP